VARRPVNRSLLLGVVLGAAGFLVGLWLVARINNWLVSAAWSLLVLALILEPLYQRWSRRRRRQRMA